jgi:hypothetical protein
MAQVGKIVELLNGTQSTSEITAVPFLERRLVWWSALVLMLLLLLLPISLVEIPPLLDYLNHLARMNVLVYGQTDPVLSRMYAAHWSVIPDIAIDVILPQMMRVLPIYAAGRVMLALCILLPTTGAVAYSRATFGRRSFWQIAAGLAAFNALFLMGFMNFEIGIGIALWAAAAWIAFRDRYPVVSIAGSVFAAVFIFFCHLFGFCFYALLVGSHELITMVRLARRGEASPRRVAARTAALAPVLLAPVVLYLLSPLVMTGSGTEWSSPAKKVYRLLEPFMAYVTALDLFTGAAVVSFLALCFLTRRARISQAAALSVIVLLVVYAALPSTLKNVGYIDSRLPVMIGFLLFAGWMPAGLRPRLEIGAAVFFALLLLVRMGLITDIWLRSQQDVAEVRQAIAQVEPGSRVLEVDVTSLDNPAYYDSMPLSRTIQHFSYTYWHLGALLLIERKAFWPLLFTAEQQPVRVKDPYRAISMPGALVPNYLDLKEHAIPQEEFEQAPYLKNWRDKFDYVLLLNAGGAGDLNGYMPDRLQLLNHNDMAALFRIRKPQLAGATP